MDRSPYCLRQMQRVHPVQNTHRKWRVDKNRKMAGTLKPRSEPLHVECRVVYAGYRDNVETRLQILLFQDELEVAFLQLDVLAEKRALSIRYLYRVAARPEDINNIERERSLAEPRVFRG